MEGQNLPVQSLWKGETLFSYIISKVNHSSVRGEGKTLLNGS